MIEQTEKLVLKGIFGCFALKKKQRERETTSLKCLARQKANLKSSKIIFKKKEKEKKRVFIAFNCFYVKEYYFN
jgi:hypothetical protein